MATISEHLDVLGVAPVDDVYRTFTPEQLRQLEQALRSRLSDDYRTFLTTHANCHFMKKVSVVAEDGQTLPLLTLHGAPVEGEVTPDLFWQLETYEDDFPEGHVAIGDDVFGNPYVLDADSGAIYYVNFEFGEFDPIPVASSFTHFVERMFAA